LIKQKKKIYWDACVWIAIANQEIGKAERCQVILDHARQREFDIWTSSLTLAEVFKKKCDGTVVFLEDSKDLDFESFIAQDFLIEAQVDHDIGVLARRLLRQFPALKKPNDAIHLATAVMFNIDEFHTYDGENLLSLNGEVQRADGVALIICQPPVLASIEECDKAVQVGDGISQDLFRDSPSANTSSL
jgi:predicted nucleic acid-binding protein